MTDFQVPTIQEEIDRKAITELERVMFGLQTGSVNIQSAAASLRTLWETVAGLIPQETMGLISESLTAVENRLAQKTRIDNSAVFVSPSATVVIQQRGTSIFISKTHPGAAPVTRIAEAPTEESRPYEWARKTYTAKLQELSTKMTRVDQ